MTIVVTYNMGGYEFYMILIILYNMRYFLAIKKKKHVLSARKNQKYVKYKITFNFLNFVDTKS